MNRELQGKTITLRATVMYPGSRVSDLLIGGEKVSLPNIVIQSATEKVCDASDGVLVPGTYEAEHRLRSNPDSEAYGVVAHIWGDTAYGYFLRDSERPVACRWSLDGKSVNGFQYNIVIG